MKWLFVIDPLSDLTLERDTTLAIVEAVVARGQDAYLTTLPELSMDLARGAYAKTLRVECCEPLQGRVEVSPAETQTLDGFDFVLMRKDPPFDMEYVYATYILEAAERSGCCVINGAAGLRDATEKLYPLLYPEFCPPQLVTRDEEEIMNFLARCGGKGVVKPLNLMGGQGILLLSLDDPNLAAIITMALHGGQERVMVQAFIEEAWEGDKRILSVDDEILGAFVRRPKAGDFRGNICAGATVAACDLTPRDEEILHKVMPDLKARGQRFIGVDIVGPLLTEINVTSPMGLREIDALTGGNSGDRLVATLIANR